MKSSLLMVSTKVWGFITWLFSLWYSDNVFTDNCTCLACPELVAETDKEDAMMDKDGTRKKARLASRIRMREHSH